MVLFLAVAVTRSNIELDLQSLVSLIENDLKNGFDLNENRYSSDYVFNSVLLYTLCSYEISLKEVKPSSIGFSNENSLNIEFQYGNSKLITDWYLRHLGGDLGIRHFINKINLLENFKN